VALVRIALVRCIAFVLGFSAVFVVLGASATAVGAFLNQRLAFFTTIAGAIVILFGLHLTGLVPIKALYREERVQLGSRPTGVFGSFLVGCAFAFGWSPCVGPILMSIVALASTQEKVLSGVALLACYSLGLGLPFIAAGVAVNSFLRLFERVKRCFRVIEISTGVLLILVGAAIIAGWFGVLSRYFALSLGG
jgi:cytochrome c-type biogenesis protein